jgi:hypothetical protein
MEAIYMDVEGGSEMDYRSDNVWIACSDCEHKARKDIDWLQKTTEEFSLQSLSQTLDEKSLASRFCCGGKIELGEYETITIDWSYSPKGEPYQIDFPLDSDFKKAKVTTLFKKLHTATKEDGTIDAAPGASVTTSFDPNSAGLVDMISQLMVPGIVQGKRGVKDRPEHIGLKATLSKLFVSYFLC